MKEPIDIFTNWDQLILEYADSRKHFFSENVRQKLAILELLISGYQNKYDATGQPLPFRKYLNDYFLFLKEWEKWLDEANLVDCSEPTSLNDTLESALRLFSSEDQQQITCDVIRPLKKDLLRVKVWKFHARRRLQIQKTVNHLTNLLRQLFNKQSRQPVIPMRTYQLEQFSRFQLRQFIAREERSWTHTELSQWATSYPRLQEAVNAMTVALNVKFSELIDQPDTAIFKEHLAQIQSILLDINTDFQRVNDEKQEEFYANWTAYTYRCHQKWSIAGTFLNPDSHYSDQKLASFESRESGRIKKDNSKWSRYYKALRDDWNKDLQLDQLNIRVILHLIDFSTSLQRKADKFILVHFNEAFNLLEENVQILTHNDKASEEYFIKQKNNLILRFRQNILPKMIQSILSAHLDKDFDNLTQSAIEAGEAIDHSMPIVHYYTKGSIIPRVRVDTIPLAELLKDEILSHFLLSCQRARNRYDHVQEQIFRDINEIDQIIEYNFNSAINLLEKQSIEEVILNIQDGLRRALRQVRDIHESITSGLNDVNQTLITSVSVALVELVSLKDSQKITALRIRWARARLIRRFTAASKNLLLILGQALPKLIRYVGDILNKLQHGYRKIRTATGLAVSEEDELRFVRKIVDIHNRSESLPYIYHHLFQIRPLEDHRFWAGREAEFLELSEIWEDYVTGFPTRVSIIGERGSGRTTLLNFFKSDIVKSKQIFTINLTRRITDESVLLSLIREQMPQLEALSLESIPEELSRKQIQGVLIIENIHLLYLKTMNGFSLLGKMIALIQAVSSGMLVIATSTTYSWQFLTRVIQIDQVFNRHIHLGPFSDEEAESIILKRHRISGYELNFKIPENDRKIRKISNPVKRQAAIKLDYFKRLNELSAGNITVAMTHWLNSVSELTSDTITLDPDLRYDTAFLLRLTMDQVFILGVILQHELMSSQEIARVLSMNPADTEKDVNILALRQVIQQINGSWSLAAVTYRPVVQMLKTKNIIH